MATRVLSERLVYPPQPAPAPAPGILSVSGNQLLVDGDPHPPVIGFRAGSASQSEAQTLAVLDMLDPSNPDGWVANGVTCWTLWLQGTSGGASRFFTADGQGFDDLAAVDRVHRLLTAAHEAEVTTILGCFYQGAPALSGEFSYDLAAGKAATEFGAHRRVIFNVANENNSSGWASYPLNFNDATKLIRVANSIHGQEYTLGYPILVGGGGYGRSAQGDFSTTTAPLFAPPGTGYTRGVDVLLFDTDSTRTAGAMWTDYMANGLNDGTGKARKPAINVETFGGSTRSIHKTQGAYTAEWFGYYQQSLTECSTRRAAGLHGELMHDNRWFQGQSITSGNLSGAPGATSPALPWSNRYDLAGQGSDTDPGVRWWLDYARTVYGI